MQEKETSTPAAGWAALPERSASVPLLNENGTAAEPPVSPLRSAEAFDAYCLNVQARLVAHANQRKHFLQNAYERLTRLLHTAKAVEDTPLYNELWQQRTAVRELLEALHQINTLNVNGATGTAAPAAAVWPTVAPPAKPVPLPASAPRDTRLESAVRADTALSPVPPSPVTASPRPNPLLVREEGPSARYEAESAPAQPRLPRHPVRPLIDIESDAVRLRSQLVDWNAVHPLVTSAGYLHAPNSMRLRAIACRQRRLEEEAGDTVVAEVVELREDIEKLLDDANDEEYAVALDYELDPRPTAFQWGELAERYEEMARAQEAFDWWQENRAMLTVADVQPLAEAVAAIQQRFNRLLFRIGARDPFQQQLFDDLRVWAKEAQCYLQSLRPKVPIAELIERAATIESAWEQAAQPMREVERRQETINMVISMVSEPDFGENPEQDEARLQEALLACRDARIPASDRRLRDALLPWGAFLEEDERFKETLREITLEWERRQEAGRAEALLDEPETGLDAISEELAAVREVTRGKRCLLLGGTCREEHRRKLEEALELSELVWPSTKPSEPLAKYETEIHHSDIVALLTRFSRKEWKNAQPLCAKEGKKFVHLTTGYGIAQVVRHFYQQIVPQGASHAQV